MGFESTAVRVNNAGAFHGTAAQKGTTDNDRKKARL